MIAWANTISMRGIPSCSRFAEPVRVSIRQRIFVKALGITDRLSRFTLMQHARHSHEFAMNKLVFAELSIAVLASSNAFAEGKTGSRFL
jgi:hypothetical protein